MTQTETTRLYTVLAVNHAENIEEHRSYVASSLAEALTMAERADAGRLSRIYGILPDDYTQARQEDIDFNEADGLLV